MHTFYKTFAILLIGLATSLNVANADKRDSWRKVEATLGAGVPDSLLAMGTSNISETVGLSFGGMSYEFFDPSMPFAPFPPTSGHLLKLDFSDIDAPIWSKLSPLNSGPAERTFAAASSSNGDFFIYGGLEIVPLDVDPFVEFINFDDLWRYDPLTNVWQEMPVYGGVVPSGRQKAILEVDEDRGLIFLTGGMNAADVQTTTVFADTWVYKLPESSDSAFNLGWNELTPAGDAPKIWIGSSALVQKNMVQEKKLVTFGGEDLLFGFSATFQDKIFLYRTESNEWSSTAANSILERVDATSEIRKHYSNVSREVYIYGGYQGGNRCAWSPLNQGPVSSILKYSVEKDRLSLRSSNSFVEEFGQRRHGSFVRDKDMLVFGGFGCKSTNGVPDPTFFHDLKDIYIYRM